MGGTPLAEWIAACFLLSLRITPVFLLAPPFTLTRVPRLISILLGIGLSAMIVSAWPDAARFADPAAASLFVGAIRELALGLVPVVVLHFMFGALYLVGRSIDIQAGFGLALLIDPQTRGQTPLMGTIFALVAGATFFAMNGHYDVLRFFVASLEQVPLGAASGLGGLGDLTAYVFLVSLLALGVGGAAILALFLTDIMVALLSRTVPQMNALLIGIQVKAILVLAVLPIALGVSGALFARLVASAVAAMPKLA